MPAPPPATRIPIHPLRATAILLTIVTVGIASSARGESSVRLASESALEPIGATTFDRDGRAIGRSSFEIETTAEGAQIMRVTMGTDDGGRTISEATLAPLAGALAGAEGRAGSGLRIVEERSQSTTADGRTFPLLVVDHQAGRVSCYEGKTTSSRGRHTAIPEDDRVVNVPMQLLFIPLVRGEVDELRFQIATCGDGRPVLHDMLAVRGSTRERGGRRVVQIEYGPDFGKAIGWLASRLLPSFSFWFDAEDGTYLGHRMPLHREGPEITMVRRGLTPPEIGID